MSDYVKSITDTEKITSALLELKEQVKFQRVATNTNNRELIKLNEVAQIVQEGKIVELENEIREMKENQKWVKGEEPAIDLGPVNLMKRLNVI